MDIEEQYDKVYRYCYFRLHDRSLAQDITQETFLRFYRKALRMDKAGELPYLYTIARNLCIDEYRRQPFGGIGGMDAGVDVEDVGVRISGSGGKAFDSGIVDSDSGSRAGVFDSSEEWIDRLALKAAIGRLPQEDQELLLLRYVNEVPVAGICRIAGISRFAVYRRLSKALKQLKLELIKEGFTE